MREITSGSTTRTIDVLVVAASDVQTESAITEQVLRSVAAEFALPVRVSYSNPFRGSKEDAAVGPADLQDESTPVVLPLFWDDPTSARDELAEPDLTQYDLIIWLVWSRFSSVPVEKQILPNGSRAGFATNGEIDPVLGQAHRIFDPKKLRVYRNRATPDSLLEPKEAREEMCRQWDTVQDFFARWENEDEIQFRERCYGFLGLEEFANSFRQHFRNFLVQRLDDGVAPNKPPLQNRLRRSNPFRGLDFFDFEHASFYYGRTKAIGEVLAALKKQAKAKKSFVLVLGPSGSGKSSLLRAGVLPLLTQGGTPVGHGPWRRLIIRPGIGDPIDTLTAALSAKFALPELPDPAAPDDSLSLASRLRKDPEKAASRIAEVLGKSKLRLALVVDQLEDLFIGVSPVLQQKFIAALSALAHSEGVYVIAALRTEFYAHFQRFPELANLTSGGGMYELPMPAEHEIANLIRLPAEAAGLHFERDSKTGRGVDESLLNGALNSADRLPLLEYVLSRLYDKQLERKDGVVLWSDYTQLGEFKNALAQHGEFVYLTLNPDERQVFKLLIRQLLAPGAAKENVLRRLPVPYHDLVSSPQFNDRQSAAARAVIDRLTNEGLLNADTDSKHCRLISLPQDALLKSWPRLSRLLSEDQQFFRMRDRLDESLRLWLSRGKHGHHLLYDRVALAEAATLVRDFGAELSKNQLDYIRRSLAKQKRHGGTRIYLGLAALVVFGLFAAILAAQRFNSANSGNQAKLEVQAAQPNKHLGSEDTTALEARLKEAEEKVQLAQQNAELANQERAALETELKTAGDQLKQLQDAELSDSNGKALQAQLKETEEKLKQAHANFEDTSSQLTALQVQLKQEQDKEQKAQANADSLTSERNALQNQLKATQGKLEQAQTNSGDTAGQLSALQAQLKQEQDKEQKAQANADSLTSERNALQNQLKATQGKLEQAQTNSGDTAGQLSALQIQLKQEQDKELKAQANADSLTSERNALQNQLKATQGKLEQAQTNSGDTAGQLSALQAQLKQEQDKEQKNQANADSLTSDRNALQNQLKATEEKLRQAQADSGDAAGQLSALQAQLKQEQDKELKAYVNLNSLTSERDALQNQLDQAEARALLAQQNADLVNSRRSEVETELEQANEKLKQAQANSGDAASQLSASQAELKQEQVKEQKAQANANSLTSERNALQNQLKATEEKLKLAHANSGDAAGQLSALQAQLKQEQDKEQKAQANADSLTSERIALQNQLEATEEKAKLAQANSGDAAGQLSALQAQLKQEQEKGKKAQANADSLTSERNALQSQLKQAEAKASLAQQNADLFSRQRNTVETQLKEAQEKLTQAQDDSDATANQFSALQAQLKQEQDKEQKAQANADSLTSERTALQSQLRQAEAKAVLAQQSVDLVNSQRSALETQLKEGEEKFKQAQVNSGDTSGELSALRAQLKQEQDKEQKAQANLDSLTSERNALQSQLKQAETKALLAQQNANLANSQRSALEAQFKDAQERLKQANASSGDTAGQLRALQARLYSSQQASPTLSPSTSSSDTANPPESPSSRNGEASGNAEPLKEFVLGYLRTVASDDTSVQRGYFADRVSFYGRGVLDTASLEASTEEYHREWPIREWTPRGEATVERSSHRGRFIVHQPFRWVVSDGSRHAQGNATLYLLIQQDSQGELRIMNVHQLDR